ncbi:MAG: hypothetical protein M3Q10_04485, partial [Chloroflexota bacterium]|nr:hypothetical protein [Chloroflexota bacterium]
MYTLLWDGRPYQTYATEALAEAARATLRRWSSCSTRLEIVPVQPVPARCEACAGSGETDRLVWQAGWRWGRGPCRGCGGSGAAPA